MAGMLGNDIKWNFGKFLLDGEGKAGGVIGNNVATDVDVGSKIIRNHNSGRVYCVNAHTSVGHHEP